MPITPLHFGPAALAKGSAPKHFSFVAFGFTQLIIDAEPAYYIVQGLWPVHRFFHTYLGATFVAVFVVVFGKPLADLLLRAWNSRIGPDRRGWLGIKPRVPLISAASGAFFGGYSHVFLDSIMHADVRPFAPWSDSNSVLQLVSLGTLNLACAGMGAAGAFLLLRLLLRRKARNRV